MHLIYFFARNVVGKIIPLLATSFYYWKVHKALKNSSNLLSAVKYSTSRLFWLSFIPVLCSLPGILGDTFEVMNNQMNSKAIILLVSLLRYVWEILNLWFYWSLQKGDEMGRDSFISETPLLETFKRDDDKSLKNLEL